MWIEVNIGAGNGLLTDGTKSLSEPMLTNLQQGLKNTKQQQTQNALHMGHNIV